MDILQLIKTDHDEVAEIIDELESLAEADDGESRARASELTEQVGRLVLLHSKSEEAALYEACKEKTKKVREFALEGFQEHGLLSLMLDRLKTKTPGPDGEFAAVLAVAKELFENHARVEEEKEAFPKLRRAFNAEAREQMGARMEEEKQRLLSELPGAELSEEEGTEGEPEVTAGDDSHAGH